MTSAGRGAHIAPAVSSSAWPRRALLSLTALSLVASAFSGSAYAAPGAELRADAGYPASRSAKLTAASDSQGDEGASSNDVNDPSSTPERPADSQPLAPRAGEDEGESSSQSNGEEAPRESQGAEADTPEGPAAEQPLSEPEAAPLLAPPANEGGIKLEVQAQAQGHKGVNEQITRDHLVKGDAIRYGSTTAGNVGRNGDFLISNDGGTKDATAFVGQGQMVYSAHGAQASCRNQFWPFGCWGRWNLDLGTEEGKLNLQAKSAVGFAPRDPGSVPVGEKFNLGYFVHVNNSVRALHGRFQANLNIRLKLAGQEKDLSFPWQLHETANDPSGYQWNGSSDDILEFTSTLAPTTFESNGHRYTLKIEGFTPTASGQCPAWPNDQSQVENKFITKENAITYGCLWASLVQVRPVTIVKQVEFAPGIADSGEHSFSYTVSGPLAELWNKTFTLQPSAQKRAEKKAEAGYNTGAELTITENTLPAGWSVKSLQCLDGKNQPIKGATINGATLTIPAGLQETDPQSIPITCTYTNLYAPTATLTLKKTLEEGSDKEWAKKAEATDWLLSATRVDGPLSAEAIGAGASQPQPATSLEGVTASHEVTGIEVLAGAYSLAEKPKTITGGLPEAAYKAKGWTCEDAPVNEKGEVRLEAGKTYTCTVTNALRTSALEWTKTDEAGRALNGSTWKLSRTSAPEVAEIPVTPGKDGAFKVDGLPMGAYRLTETAAPAGFRKLAAPVDITIDEDGKVRGLPEDGKIRNAALQTPVLPLTGGAGSDAFLIAGSALLILCAGALWIAQRRRKHRDA